jgi:peptide/nickel transport system substrate-binding protein
MSEYRVRREPGDDGSGLTRNVFLRRSAVVGAAVALPGVIAACDDDDGNGGGGNDSAGTQASAEGGTPVRGGHLITGLSGSSVDTLDPHLAVNMANDARGVNIFDRLMYQDRERVVHPMLAESLEAEGGNADRWVLRIRDGVTFHDGKPLTIDDVIYSIRRILDPKVGSGAREALSTIDEKRMKKLDDRTVRLTLKRPDSVLPVAFTNWQVAMVQEDFDPKKAIGTGPFKLESFTPKQRTEMSRFDGFWEDDRPYLDELTIIQYQDNQSRINALLSGEVAAIDRIPYANAQVIEERDDLRLINAEGGIMFPLYFRVDRAPFNDKRVRQAMRLIPDREQTLESAIGGFGTVANDMYQNVSYPDVPQREQDIEQAKSLLSAAGVPDLTFTIAVATGTAGPVESAQVFAEQAKAAGVTANVNAMDGSVYYGDRWTKWPVANDYWSTRIFINQVQTTSLPNSPFNESGFPTEEVSDRWMSLYEEAIRTVDEDKRVEIEHELQQIQYDEGAEMISTYGSVLDAVKTEVKGLEPSLAGLSIDYFGFRHAWLEQ